MQEELRRIAMEEEEGSEAQGNFMNELNRELKNRFNLSQAKVKPLLNELVKEGLIAVDGDNIIITAKGRSYPSYSVYYHEVNKVKEPWISRNNYRNLKRVVGIILGIIIVAIVCELAYEISKLPEEQETIEDHG
jgi:hypothetical protein